jgi:hypothetical protein
VDAVIKSMLGGEVSQETRAILLSGENPMLGKLSASDTTFGAPMADERLRNPRRAEVGKNGQPRPNAPAMRALDRPVNLEGLAQVVGLALGSPEFQRR